MTGPNLALAVLADIDFNLKPFCVEFASVC